MAASSSSSSSFSGVDPSLCKYDVFISFISVETRGNFTRELCFALRRRKIRAFHNFYGRGRMIGVDISRALPKAIEESAISIIVFSTDYASSTRCLDELVEILKCKKEKGQIVLPIFVGVDPSDVRRQESSYAAAFVEHEQRFKNQMDKVQEWRQALTEASNLAGWDSRDMSQSELVEAVVLDVLRRLTELWSTSIDNSNGLMGGDFLSAFLEDLFHRLRSPDFLDYLKGKEPIPKLLNDVETRLLSLSAIRVRNDAEEKQLTDDRVKKWLDRLREQIFRADDLTENVNYEVLIRKLRGASDSSTSIATFGKSRREEILLRRILSQMKDELGSISRQLEGLIAETGQLGLEVLSLRSHGEPLILESDVYGREDDKEATMKLVQSDNKAMVEAPKKAFKPQVYGREDAKKAFKPDVYGGEDAKKADLNAHPDLAIIGEEKDDVDETNFGEYLNAHPDLQGIGEEIVNKCKGHPIAVKSVVALLCSIPSPDEWRKILENHIWDLKLQEKASKYVLPALWLSYRYLSPQLKRCFAYCSIFPKDYEFTQKEVILLWMAEGFLKPKGGTRMEDVGEEYFKILTSRSFFHQLVHDKSKFTMHDCVHDLATFVLGDFGFWLEYDTRYVRWRTRYLSFPKEKIGNEDDLYGFYNLRTFLPLESNQPFRDAVPLEKLLTDARLIRVRHSMFQYPCFRVLSLSQYPHIAELPDSILDSKHLRYLDLSSTSIRNVPDTICTLYNLETLLLSNCENLTRLPSEIRRLIKLRHLDFAGSPIKELPPRICELTNLQTLTRFIMCKEHSRIEELGHLQQLHGEFEICGLENVVDVKSVFVAKLWEKKFLKSLGLYWDGESCDGTLKEREKILDQLMPHENLKALRIYGFAGEWFPDWMGDQSFGNMVEVQLSECKNCKSLPPLGQLPSLKNLQISGFKSVETIGPEFYSDGSSTTKPFRSLEVLHFEDMAMWKGGLFTKDQVFPSLKELVFYECPKLDVWLPDCFPSLTKLLVSHCRQLMPLLIPMTHQHCGFRSLEELEIFACPKQVIFLQGGLPSSLKKIKISRCESLKLLHCKDFQHLTSLERFEIIECKELHHLPEELPTYPFELSIVECPFLQSGGIEDLLLRLTTKLQLANKVLNDAEEKQLADKVAKKWLDALKEFIFRAEELTEKINYEELRRQLEGATESSTSFATSNKSVEAEIEEILLKLEELIAKNDEHGLKELTEKPEVYGMEDAKEAIMKLSLSDETYGDKRPTVLPALLLSYRSLSSQLKRCFAYCSIFPRDYKFTKKEVILLWMAEGFLQPEGGTRMEDVGEEYFMTLTSSSCFQQSVHDKSKFTMHDWHDLATFVLGDFGFRLDDDNMHNIPSNTRHLSFMKEKVGDMRYFQGISEVRHLRTFLPLESNQPFTDTVPLEELLTEKECLRVLSLSQYPRIAELPNSILESKPLRYLDLSSTSIRNIPDTICTLYNLETLLLSNCENLTRLPSEIRRLIKLRHLDFAGSLIEELPPRICELKDLQTLTRFIVCKEHSRIEELGDLQQLHGEFEICGLENVVDVKKVSVAKLREKKFLTSLGLYWDGESCDTLKEREKILDLLLPHENLKALRIYGFAGERFPDWMGDQSFVNIVEVQLSECKNCKSLPPLGQLPSLKNLQISGFKSVETIGPEFYSNGSSMTKPFGSLEVLRFEDMAKWEKWLFPKDQGFPCLKELVFYECPELDVWLPDCFPSLTKLLVSHCRQLMPLRGFQSLEELEIFACPKQVIFLQDGWPSRLKKIKISRCESLKLLHCIQSKKERELLHCKDFQHLNSLESLEIIECKELHRLPEELPTNPFELSIVECPFLESGGWESEEDWSN